MTLGYDNRQFCHAPKNAVSVASSFSFRLSFSFCFTFCGDYTLFSPFVCLLRCFRDRTQAVYMYGKYQVSDSVTVTNGIKLILMSAVVQCGD